MMLGRLWFPTLQGRGLNGLVFRRAFFVGKGRL
jgi:hypothetical protein